MHINVKIMNTYEVLKMWYFNKAPV